MHSQFAPRLITFMRILKGATCILFQNFLFHSWPQFDNCMAIDCAPYLGLLWGNWFADVNNVFDHFFFHTTTTCKSLPHRLWISRCVLDVYIESPFMIHLSLRWCSSPINAALLSWGCLSFGFFNISEASRCQSISLLPPILTVTLNAYWILSLGTQSSVVYSQGLTKFFFKSMSWHFFTAYFYPALRPGPWGQTLQQSLSSRA